MPRFYCPLALQVGSDIDLPAGAARHVQVLRLQPGDGITLFHGGLEDVGVDAAALAGEFDATIVHMGRAAVRVRVERQHAIGREAARAVHLAVAIMANERMDWLVEKATELGAASLTPLLAERSVLRLAGERADKKRAHWQAIAVAACEQCGRNRVPRVHPVQTLADWLRAQGAGQALPPSTGLPAAPSDAPVIAAPQRLLLSLQPHSIPLRAAAAAGIAEGKDGSAAPVQLLSGPEGGLSSAEEALALQQGWTPVTLGPRTLRAETAPLAALAVLTI